MIMFKSFYNRISKDFWQKELMPLKLLFFVQASTLYVLYPYLTIHMRELGINVEETAIMNAITPVMAMVMPPLAGMLADRIGNFRILLSVFSVFGGFAALLLLLVPIGRVTVHFPERIIMDLDCQDRSNSLFYTMSQTHPCERKLGSEIAMKVESCGFVCQVDNETDQSLIPKSKFYIVRYFNSQTGVNVSYKYAMAQSDLSTSVDQQEDIKEHRQLKNNEFFKTTIRQISKTHYFFPTDQLFSFSCVSSGHVQDIDNSEISHGLYRNYTSCVFGHLIKPENDVNSTIYYHSYKSKIKSLELDGEDLREERQRYSADEISLAEDFQKLTCDNPESTHNRIAIDMLLYNHNANLESTRRVLSTNECNKRCIVTAPRNSMCSNMDTEIELNVSLTFWVYLIIRVFISIIGGTTFAMFEGAVIAILREQDADYGLQRIYGSLGGMISSPLSGLLIDYASRDKGYTDFRPAFYLYTALKLASAVLMLLINLEFKPPAKNVVRDVFTVLKNIEIAALFLACFVLGTAWGYIEAFLFWLIQDLGGSKSFMGVTITVSSIAGIPLLALSEPIISKIGHANVLFLGFVFYAIRLCGYSLVYNVWLILIFEALESVSTSLSFTAAVTYAAKLSSISTDSSIQGLLGGVNYGVGKGTGSLIGGYLIKAFGNRPTYQIFAVVTLLTGIIYFIFNVTYLKKRSQLRDDNTVKEKFENVSSQNSPEKHTNNINLDKKPQDEVIKENESNLKESDSIDNGEILKKIENYKSSEEKNKKNLTKIKVIRNAENVNQNEENLTEKPEDKSTPSDDAIKAEKSDIQETCFTNPNVQTDNQCKIGLEDKQIDKDIDRVSS
ncbi:uncharacterized protein [Linepithema humile]|uniref:uncharacterized protein n=1 Tax=Linepithema humile TaxID=83485 RepID=UPI00351EBB14